MNIILKKGITYIPIVYLNKNLIQKKYCQIEFNDYKWEEPFEIPIDFTNLVAYESRKSRQKELPPVDDLWDLISEKV